MSEHEQGPNQNGPEKITIEALHQQLLEVTERLNTFERKHTILINGINEAQDSHPNDVVHGILEETKRKASMAGAKVDASEQPTQDMPKAAAAAPAPKAEATRPAITPILGPKGRIAEPKPANARKDKANQTPRRSRNAAKAIFAILGIGVAIAGGSAIASGEGSGNNGNPNATDGKAKATFVEENAALTAKHEAQLAAKGSDVSSHEKTGRSYDTVNAVVAHTEIHSYAELHAKLQEAPELANKKVSNAKNNMSRLQSFNKNISHYDMAYAAALTVNSEDAMLGGVYNNLNGRDADTPITASKETMLKFVNAQFANKDTKFVNDRANGTYDNHGTDNDTKKLIHAPLNADNIRVVVMEAANGQKVIFKVGGGNDGDQNPCVNILEKIKAEQKKGSVVTYTSTYNHPAKAPEVEAFVTTPVKHKPYKPTIHVTPTQPTKTPEITPTPEVTPTPTPTPTPVPGKHDPSATPGGAGENSGEATNDPGVGPVGQGTTPNGYVPGEKPTATPAPKPTPAPLPEAGSEPTKPAESGDTVTPPTVPAEQGDGADAPVPTTAPVI